MGLIKVFGSLLVIGCEEVDCSFSKWLLILVGFCCVGEGHFGFEVIGFVFGVGIDFSAEIS